MAAKAIISKLLLTVLNNLDTLVGINPIVKSVHVMKKPITYHGILIFFYFYLRNH